MKNDPEARATGSEQTRPIDGRPVDGGACSNDAWLCAALTALPRAIQLLTAAEQAAVIGYYFDERPIEELAAALDLRTERVELILQQALRELRRVIPG